MYYANPPYDRLYREAPPERVISQRGFKTRRSCVPDELRAVFPVVVLFKGVFLLVIYEKGHHFDPRMVFKGLKAWAEPAHIKILQVDPMVKVCCNKSLGMCFEANKLKTSTALCSKNKLYQSTYLLKCPRYIPSFSLSGRC